MKPTTKPCEPKPKKPGVSPLSAPIPPKKPPVPEE